MRSKLTQLRAVIWWGMTLAWAVQIFFLSTQSFAPSFSQSLVAEVFRFLHLQVSPVTFDLLHAAIRKLAHLTEYGIFALFLYGPPSQGKMAVLRPRRAGMCILVAAAYSLTDEFHQSFVPGRHASLFDCGLDTLGATLAMLVPYFLKFTFYRSAASASPVRTA